MNNTLYKKNNRTNLYTYIILGIVIMVSDDTLLFGTNINQIFINARYLIHLMLFGILVILILFRKIEIDKKGLIICIFLILISLMSGLINNDLSLGYYYKVLIISLGFLITTFIPWNTFIVCYDKIITLLASLSLIINLLYQFFEAIVRPFPTFTNTTNLEFYNLFITYIPKAYSYGGELVRNWGFFREPGVFQMYLILGLLTHLFILKTPKLFNTIIYLLTIISTFSTTAYIALFIIICIYFATKKRKNNDKIIKRVLFALVILATVFVILFYREELYSCWNSVFGKLVGFNSFSATARLASVRVNIRAFLEKPLFGVGLNNLYEIFTLYALQTTGKFARDNTNTILVQFATHGIIYGFLWILGYWNLSIKMTYDLNNKKLISVLFFSIFTILFIGENVTWGLLAYVLLFYGYNSDFS